MMGGAFIRTREAGVEKDRLRRDGGADRGGGGRGAVARSHAHHLRAHGPRPDRARLGARSSHREPRRPRRPPHRRHPQRHLRQRRRAHHHHLRPLGGPDDRGKGLDHRLHHRQRALRARREPAARRPQERHPDLLPHHRRRQRLDARPRRRRARARPPPPPPPRPALHASLLALVAVALALPPIFAATTPGTPPTSLSVEVAVIMFVIYILYLIFIFRSPEGQPAGHEHEPQFGRIASFVVLFVATAAGAHGSA